MMWCKKLMFAKIVKGKLHKLCGRGRALGPGFSRWLIDINETAARSQCMLRISLSCQ